MLYQFITVHNVTLMVTVSDLFTA